MIEYDEYKGKILGLRPTLDNLGSALKLDEARREIACLEKESARDDFWSDLDNSQKVLQKIKQLKNKCGKYDGLVQRYEDMEALCLMAMEENDESLLPELQEEYAAQIAQAEETLSAAEGELARRIAEGEQALAAARRELSSAENTYRTR